MRAYGLISGQPSRVLPPGFLMDNSQYRPIAQTLIAAGLCLHIAAAHAQAFPNRPIRLVTTEAGSGGDLMARLAGQVAARGLGQQVVVDNRGISAIDIVQKARSDGYTLLLYGPPLWLTPLMRDSISWELFRDFSPVTLTTNAPNILVVHPAVPVQSVQQLIALAKAIPGEVNYASGSTGTSSHLAAELFRAMTGVNILRIAYRGSGPGINALVGGQVQLMFPSAGGVTAHVKSGKLRALAVTTAQASSLVAGLPPLAAFVPGFESSSNLGIFVPSKTPEAIIARLNREFVQSLNNGDVKNRLFSAGLEVIASTPGELASTIKSEVMRLGKVIKDAGIRDE